MAQGGIKRGPLLGALAGLMLAQGLLHTFAIFPTWSKRFNPVKPGQNLVQGSLSPDQMVFALLGFREWLAGILWVRADSFFDSGQYDAILPIIRLVTFLDPKQIDVYATGMWHIGYNFTDEEQRSDRRYIPSALALGKQGFRNNPETYELFFETGWMWYHKVDDDYDQAVKYMDEANKRADIIPARRNLRSVVLQRAGRVDDALNNYYDLLDTATALAAKEPNVYQNRSNRDVIAGNIDTTIVRMMQRGYFASKDKRPLTGYDTNPPFDVGFSARVSVLEPRVLRVEGTWNVLPVGTRVRCVLKDADYKPFSDFPAEMAWDSSDDVNIDPPRDRTFMQEQLFVRNRRFDKKIDMSRDPTMYPARAEKYIIEFYYNPRSAPPHIQDKFGWNGEGLTDKNFLNTTVRPGVRCFYTTLEITRDQLLRKGEWQDQTPVLKTKNFVDNKNSYNKSDTIIDIPSLRSK